MPRSMGVPTCSDKAGPFVGNQKDGQLHFLTFLGHLHCPFFVARVALLDICISVGKGWAKVTLQVFAKPRSWAIKRHPEGKLTLD